MKLKNLLLMLLCISTFTFTSCSTDDSIPVPNVIRTGAFVVEDQVLMNNMLIINNVNVTQQSWLVLRRGGETGEIISKPKLIKKGEAKDVKIELKAGVTINDGDVLTAVLHKDTGAVGRFEFDGESGVDTPIMTEAGEPAMDTFTVTVLPEPTGSLMVADQALVDNMLTIELITLDRAGWVVVHADNGENAPVVPNIISEPVYLEEGTHTDVEIMIKESAELMAEDIVWVMLHTDTGTAEVYEFDGKNGFDKPILGEDGSIVMESIMITGVEDTSNTMAFAELDANSDGMLDMNEVPMIYQDEFQEWDMNNDGMLNEDEFNTTTMFLTDTDDDGMVSQEEFNVGQQSLFGDWITDDFGTLDADGDGFLSDSEWNTAVMDSEWFEDFDADGDTMVSEDEWDMGVFGVWDTNDDDSIDQEEFNQFGPFAMTWAENTSTGGGTSGRNFSDFDANSDGMINAEELPAIYQDDFAEWDMNDDGMLDRDEFDMTAFSLTDANDDDMLSEDEWNAGFNSFFGNWIENDFATFDADSDGMLSDEEWTSAFADSEWFSTFDSDDDSMVSEDEWDMGLFNDWDANDDSSIDEDEFNNFIPFVNMW